jgi:tRNA modification GTPase
MKPASTATIYALASGAGKAGIAVTRISGPCAREAATFLSGDGELKPRLATLRTLRHQGRLIDQAIVIFFPGPQSFTGEDVVELHTHGSPAVMKLLYEALSTFPDGRLAEPGEFTRRAFLHGRMDLTQAEGLADLIEAQTIAQHRQAMRQFSGDMARRLEDLRDAVLAPLALLEAYIDFPDEEIPASVLGEVVQHVAAVGAEIQSLLADGHVGEKIREGIEIVIIGPPNAGKSSLINLLSRRDIAIVSDEPGTTRDMIEVQLDLGGYAVTLVDTAGLREASGEVEAEGVRRAYRRAATAELKICLLDAAEADSQIIELKDLIDLDTLLFLNKIDRTKLYPRIQQAIGISIKTGENIDKLLILLKDKVEAMMDSAPSPLITRARHREALTAAFSALETYSPSQPLELGCEELRQAANEIGKMTGKIRVDDVLDLVFSRFCIGK